MFCGEPYRADLFSDLRKLYEEKPITSREISFECRNCLNRCVPPFETASVLQDKLIIESTVLDFPHGTRKALFVGGVVENSAVSVYYISQMSEARRDDWTAETDG